MLTNLLLKQVFLTYQRLALVVSFLKKVSAIIVLEFLLFLNNWLWGTLWFVVATIMSMAYLRHLGVVRRWQSIHNLFKLKIFFLVELVV